MPRRVTVRFEGVGELEQVRADLKRASLYARGVSGLALNEACEVELVHPGGRSVVVEGRAVLSAPDGTALCFSAKDAPALAAFLAEPSPASGSTPRPPKPPETASPLGLAGGGAAVPAPPQGLAGGEAAPPVPSADAPVEGEAPAAAEDEPEAGEDTSSPGALRIHERLRGLTVVEQLRVAREGELAERVVLERLYSKAVWDALLRNSRVTVVEVARIARMGSLPKPLVELVVANAGWLQSGQVRRALLSNPRLAPDLIAKVLQAMPRGELKLAPQQTAYSAAVRAVAKKLLKPPA